MQRGTIIRRRLKQGQVWTLFYYDLVFKDGKRKQVRRSKQLAPVSKEHPTARSVRTLADDILSPLNRKQMQPESSLKITEFIEERYFPAMVTELRKSTLHNYKVSIYDKHLKDNLGDLRVRDARTVHFQRLMREIKGVQHLTLLHIKNFLSGVFKFARQQGVIDGLNPLLDVTVPGRPRKFTGAAYTIEDTEAMLEAFDTHEFNHWTWKRSGKLHRVFVGKESLETASDVIALLSLTGLRQSEARGLRWSDWNEQEQSLNISRAVWGKHVDITKNPQSEDAIPVLPLLRELLSARRERITPTVDDYVFAGTKNGTPLNFHNLQNRVIVPALTRAKEKVLADGEIIIDEASGVEWEGFHGFRRGLATNLLELDVDPVLVAALTRHKSVATTLAFYAKARKKETRAAMEKLEERIRNRATGVSYAK